MMTDRTLRYKLQLLGYWYASSRHNGPAHIISPDRLAICGTSYDTRAYKKATNLCKRCKQGAIKIIGG